MLQDGVTTLDLEKIWADLKRTKTRRRENKTDKNIAPPGEEDGGAETKSHRTTTAVQLHGVGQNLD